GTRSIWISATSRADRNRFKLGAGTSRPMSRATAMTTSFEGSLLLIPAMAAPTCFDFLLDVADDVAHLAAEDRLVQDPRAQELLDQPLEPKAQCDHAGDLADDLHLAPNPRPCDSADP